MGSGSLTTYPNICGMYCTGFHSHSASHTGLRPWRSGACLAGRPPICPSSAELSLLMQAVVHCGPVSKVIWWPHSPALSVNQSVWLIDWEIDWLIDWLRDWVRDWLRDWLIERSYLAGYLLLLELLVVQKCNTRRYSDQHIKYFTI